MKNETNTNTAVTVETANSHATTYIESLKTALTSDSSVVDIPIISNKFDGFKKVRIDTYLPKYIKPQDMISWKNNVILMVMHEQIELFKVKAEQFKMSHERNINDDDEEYYEYWTDKNGNIVDSTFIDNYNTYFIIYEMYFNEFAEKYNLDVEYLQLDHVLLCMCNAIAGTPLPSEFKKDEKLFTFICDNAVVYFKNRNKDCTNELQLKQTKETATRLKGFIIEFYKRYLKYNPTGNPSIDEMHEQLAGGCNTEMLNSIASAIYKGIQINKEGRFERAYGNYNKMASELSKCYLLYLQNEYTSNSITAPRNDKKQEEKQEEKKSDKK